MSARSSMDSIPLTPESMSRSGSESPSPPATPRELDVVIAHYNEDLSWLGAHAPFCTVYSKGNPPAPKTRTSPFRVQRTLPNIGRESHTYLWHIVHHWDDLADVTLFLQGSIHDENDGTPAHTSLSIGELADRARRLHDPAGSGKMPPLFDLSGPGVDTPPGAVMPIGKVMSFSDWDGIRYVNNWLERRGKTLVRSRLTPGDFWNLVYSYQAESPRAAAGIIEADADSHSESGVDDDDDEEEEEMSVHSRPHHHHNHLVYHNGQNNNTTTNTTNGDVSLAAHPAEIRFVQGALFAVTKASIHRHPRDFYARVLAYFEDMNETNPEEGHYMERFWLSFFEGPVDGRPVEA